MNKKAKAKKSFLFFFPLVLIASGLYILFSAQKSGFSALRTGLVCAFVVLVLLFWFAAKVYKRISSFTADILDKYSNLERLLLDVRDGTRTFYKEKRKFHRARTNGKISAEVVNKDIDKLIKVLNISYEGALLRSRKKSLHAGEIIDLNIYLPLFTQPIDVKTRVVRAEPIPDKKKATDDVVGVEYLNMTRTDREKLIETVNALNKTRLAENL